MDKKKQDGEDGKVKGILKSEKSNEERFECTL